MLKAVAIDPAMPGAQMLIKDLKKNGICLFHNPLIQMEPFFSMLKELGITKREAVVISDSGNVVCAAKASGIACIGFINHGFGGQDLSKADVLMESFLDVDTGYVENVLKRANGEPITIAKTKRITIREMTVEDVKALYSIYQDEKVRQYVDDLEESLEEEEEKMRAYIQYAYGFFGYGIWGVFDESGTRLIGRCGIGNTTIEGEDEIELSYLLDRQYWGCGYGLECTRTVLRYASEYLGIKRVVAVISTGNERSVRLAKRLGMHYEKEVERGQKRCFVYAIESIPDTLKTAAATYQTFRENRKHPDTSVYGRRYEK
ncbi:MAG: GNAT family N-acetyltransferase [Clostridiales bacterium]|nr:GNAT family N-acetyltransferase [Clostridiales bacterium]